MLVAFLLISLSCSAISLPASVTPPTRLVQKRNVLDEDFLQKLGRDVYDRSATRKALDDRILTGLRDARNRRLWRMMLSGNCGGGDCGSEEYVTESEDQQQQQPPSSQALAKLMMWSAAARQHTPAQNYNTSGDYVAAMNMWRNLNLSGRREVSFTVEEPHYIIVRREREDQDQPSNLGLEYDDDPFIPPRGRKHMPILDELVNRIDLFIPNRGKKDKIRDIFKYDDLFIPNRGKKQTRRPTAMRSRSESESGPMIDSTPSSFQSNGRTRSNCLTHDYDNDVDSNGNGNRFGGGGGGGDLCRGQPTNDDDIQTNGNDQSVRDEIHHKMQRTDMTGHGPAVGGPQAGVALVSEDISTHKLRQHPIRSEQWDDYYS